MIFITGASGFVGSAIVNSKEFGEIVQYKRGDVFNFNKVVTVLHLAGKAHDLKNTSHVSDYYEGNTELTKKVFDAFLLSDAKVFITLSSVKAVADNIVEELSENDIARPVTHYGKSKLLAEEYILSHTIPKGKRVYILRPCMIHGRGNKGNLNLLFRLVIKGVPWPLGTFENNRSFCSINNLLFVFKELIERNDIASGVYNIADDEALSTNELIGMIARSQGKTPKIWYLSKSFIYTLARVGDVLRLPFNSERLQKLTDSYVVSNIKLVNAIGKPLPVSCRDGLKMTFNAFNS